MRSILFLFLFLSLFSGTISYTCKSPSGNDVDWYVAYKLPNLGPKGDGTAFLYADSSSTSWQLSNKSVEDKRSAIGLTVSQLFAAKQKEEHFYALFNDEDPNTGKTDSGRAHMKGVVVSDDISGFWLVHSVPKFPASKGSEYVYPLSGKRNGQSLLCVTFSSSTLQEIGKQLFVAQPNIYDSHLPDSFARHFPDLASAVSRQTFPYKKKPTFSVIGIQSRKGQKFQTFFKHKMYGKDLYNDLVAPELRTSLYVETWLVGKGDLPSECATSYKVHNVLSLHPSNIAFKSSEDHSKWAVSEEKSGAWTCIGDINRQKSQEKRGGGTVCIQNAKIASLYQNAVGKVECCEGEAQC